MDRSGNLDIDEFLEFMESHYSFNEPVASDLRPVFRVLAPDETSGRVKVGGIRRMFERNSGNMRDFNDMVKGIPDDEEIDFKTFVQLVTGIEIL